MDFKEALKVIDKGCADVAAKRKRHVKMVEAIQALQGMQAQQEQVIQGQNVTINQQAETIRGLEAKLADLEREFEQPRLQDEGERSLNESPS